MPQPLAPSARSPGAARAMHRLLVAAATGALLVALRPPASAASPSNAEEAEQQRPDDASARPEYEAQASDDAEEAEAGDPERSKRAEGEPKPKTGDTRSRRFLDGHVFVPNSLTELPFMTRDYGMNIGLGYELVQTTEDQRKLADDLGLEAEDQYEFADVTLTFRSQQPIGPFFALRGAFAAQLRSGAGDQSLLVGGSRGGFAGLGGLAVRLARVGPFVATASVDAVAGRSYDVLPAVILLESFRQTLQNVRGGNFSEDAFEADISSIEESRVRTLGVDPALRMAVRLAPPIGLLGRIGYKWRQFEPEQGSSVNTQRLAASTALSVDLTRIHLPLGLTTGYEFESSVEGPGSDLHRLSGGLYLMHEAEFVFGAEAKATFRNGTDDKEFAGTLVMRYYR